MPVAADITKIEAPSSAPAGQQIIADVSIKNISSSDKYLSVTAVYDGTWLPFQFDYLLVSPGQTVIFRGAFTMPNKGVRITAGGFYWDGSKWVLDETMIFDIALYELKPQFRGFAFREYVKA